VPVPLNVPLREGVPELVTVTDGVRETVGV